MRTVNVWDDPYELWEWSVENGWTDCTYEDWNVLEFFEGDPDIIKVNGDTGYFFYRKDNDTIYYWFDECFTGYNISAILVRFYEHRLHKEYTPDVQSWAWWDSAEDGIAYRGGSGYVYTIFPLHFADRYAA